MLWSSSWIKLVFRDLGHCVLAERNTSPPACVKLRWSTPLVIRYCLTDYDYFGSATSSFFFLFWQVAVALEKAALSDEYFIKRRLYPNVDFYSGLIYRYFRNLSSEYEKWPLLRLFPKVFLFVFFGQSDGVPNRIFSCTFCYTTHGWVPCTLARVTWWSWYEDHKTTAGNSFHFFGTATQFFQVRKMIGASFDV